MLEREYDITTAPNGQAGIEKAFEIIPDIIISDVMMPEKDGYEVCETLKTDERTSHIPIILLTAKGETSDRTTGLRKAADAYLMKPFDKEELYVRLEKLLELRRALQLRYAKMSDGVTSSQPVTSGPEPNLESAFLNKLRLAVEEHLDDPNFDVPQLCRAAHLSNMQVNRKLKALTGNTPSRFIRSVRLHKAREMLQTTDLTVSEIATIGIRGTGWYAESDPEQTYFCTCFGVTELAASNDAESRETVEAKHHDRPLYILGKAAAGKSIRNAPFINHTDQELMLIETLVGRTPPFVFPKDAYGGPRREY